MSAALNTTQGARNLRPAAAAFAAVLVAAAVLAVLIGLAVSRTATTTRQADYRAPHPIVVRNPSVGGAAGLGQATGIEHANGGTAAIPGTKSVVTGIPYVGTGPTADKIRNSSVPTVGATTTGIPYVGTGTAAQKIRGNYISATDTTNVLIVRGTTNFRGIPYVGTGPTAQKIRDASVSGATAPTGLVNASGLEHANGGSLSSSPFTAGDAAASGPVVGDMSSAAYDAMRNGTSVSAKAGNGEDMSTPYQYSHARR